MLERLEKFQAPPSWHDLLPGAVMLCIALVACNLDYESAKVDEKIIKESATKAEAPSGAGTTLLPLAYPLGCPEEDEAGRKLAFTMWLVNVERRPRCYYEAKK